MTVIRPALGSDLDAVATLEAKIFAEESWSPRSVEAEFEQLGQTRVILVADEGSETVGYAVMMYAGGVGDLSRIAVSGGHRRRGVATELLAAVVDHAHRLGLDQLILEVAEDNDPATSLYRVGGFDEIDRRPRYYSDGRAAVVMRRPVAKPSRSQSGPADG